MLIGPIPTELGLIESLQDLNIGKSFANDTLCRFGLVVEILLIHEAINMFCTLKKHDMK